MTAKTMLPSRNTRQRGKGTPGRGAKRSQASSRQEVSEREAERVLLGALRAIGAERALEVITAFEQVEAWKRLRLRSLAS